MSVNRRRLHVFVLPEDDANRQLAIGFLSDQYLSNGQAKVLREAGGWTRALERFKENEVAGMDRFPERLMVLLIDLDGRKERLTQAKAEIPSHLVERVFILGALTKPEALKQAGLGSYEQIGLTMAKDCREGTDGIWAHDLLRHNASELGRLQEKVRPFLFPPY
jgi:hypothetical protein